MWCRGRRLGASAPALLVLAAGGAGLLGCPRPASTRRPEEPLRIACEAPFRSLDPVAAADAITKSVLSNLFDPLVETDREMKLVPALAMSWGNPTERTWVLTLRLGVRAHDGSALTAPDVKESLERAVLDPASGLRERLATISAVEAVGAATVRITTHQPDPLLLYRLSDVYVYPRASRADLARRPVGTGPYRLVRREGGTVELEAFDQHWRGRPRVRRVQILTVEPGRDTVQALRDGRADVLRWVPEDRLDEVRALPGLRVASRRGLRVAILWPGAGPDGRGPGPFADRRVRQALSLAIDRARLVAELGGTDEAMTQFVPPGVLGHVPGARLFPYDPAAARRLLREAGYPSGIDTALSVTASTRRMGEALQRQLAQAAIRVSLDVREWPALLSGWRKASLPLFIGSWWFTTGDASLFLKECLSSRDPAIPEAWNPGYASPRVDALIRENLASFGEARRAEQFRALSALLAEEVPVLPFLLRHDHYAVRDGVRWEPRLDGRLLAFEMERSTP